jgi:hypothetical protein
LNVKTDQKKTISNVLRRDTSGPVIFNAPVIPPDNKDNLIKSRHSGGSVRPTVGLYRIGCFCNALEKKDSHHGPRSGGFAEENESPRMTGQTGMTISRYYGPFFSEFTNKALIRNMFINKFLLSRTLCSFEKTTKSRLQKRRITSDD